MAVRGFVVRVGRIRRGRMGRGVGWGGVRVAVVAVNDQDWDLEEGKQWKRSHRVDSTAATT